WDLAYYDLEAAPGEIPELLHARGAVGSQRDSTGDAGALAQPLPSATTKQAMASESAVIRRAIGRERLYLRLVRVWRYLHTALSIVTLGLILWHLEFAATLLMGRR
ncbi:MAG TPA: hypothetical protein VGN32_02960, partial [Ktedonobacterales bacterium]|nr:hypothetical protein [Ktedonobacterales bacterium]